MAKNRGGVWLSVISPGEVVKAQVSGKEKERTIDGVVVGCHACPLNVLEHTTKFTQARSTGKPMLWFRSPTEFENSKGEAGYSAAFDAIGRFFPEVGMEREDFEIRYGVKCFPRRMTAERGLVRLNGPTAEHYIHCSQHSENLVTINARARKKEPTTALVFGVDIAVYAFEGEFKKTEPIFWSERHQCKVFVLAHPTPELVDGDSPTAEAWRSTLRAALWSASNPGRYSFLWSLDVRTITTRAEMRQLIVDIKASGETVTCDIEDDGRGKMLVVGFCYDPSFSTVLLLEHPENDNYEPGVEEELRAFLADESINKVFQYGSYDAVEFRRLGYVVKSYTFDTFYGSFLRQTYHRMHGLAAIAQREFPDFADYKTIVERYYSKDEGEEDNALDRGGHGLARCPLPTLTQYNGADTILTKLAEMALRPHIKPALMLVFIRSGATLRKMSENGPILDTDHRDIVRRVAARRVEEILSALRSLTKNPAFNPGSPPEVLYYLHEVFGLPRLADFDEDAMGRDDDEEATDSSDEATLTRIYEETNHPFPRLVLDYRKFSRYGKSYADAYTSSAAAWGGEVRTRYGYAATCRLRSGGGKRKKNVPPKFINLQNIARTSFIKNLLVSDSKWRMVYKWAGKAINHARKTAPPPVSSEWKDWVKENKLLLASMLPKLPEAILALTIFVMFDLSQAELRVLAYFSRDPELIRLFKLGDDIHCLVGEALGLGTFAEIKKNKELRSKVKNMNFGLVFGLSPRGLYYYMKSMGSHASFEEVEMMHRRYFAKFRGVARLIEQRQREWTSKGFVETEWGMRRWCGPEYEPGRKTSWDRIAMNSPIQGTSHLFMLMAMAVLEWQPQAFPLLQSPSFEVHDSLFFKSPVRHCIEAYKQAKPLLEKVPVKYSKDFFGVNFDVPIIAEGGVGFRCGVELETPNIEQPLPNLLLDWLLKDYEIEALIAEQFGYDVPVLTGT